MVTDRLRASMLTVTRSGVSFLARTATSTHAGVWKCWCLYFGCTTEAAASSAPLAGCPVLG